MIVSRSERASPAARIAPNDEPYSMMRCSPRCHHTRCGIWCTSGCAPVEIDARQTGVNDGKTEAARRYSPWSARKRIAGVSAASNIDGVRPSITITTTGFGISPLVLCERAQAGMPVRRAASQAQAEHRHRDRLEVADDGHECERGDDERREPEQRRGPSARPAAAERAGDERRRAERAADRADDPTDGLVPLPERETDRGRDDGGDDERDRRAAQHSGGGNPERRAQADEDPDRVPVAHRAPSVAPPLATAARWASFGDLVERLVARDVPSLVCGRKAVAPVGGRAP